MLYLNTRGLRMYSPWRPILAPLLNPCSLVAGLVTGVFVGFVSNPGGRPSVSGAVSVVLLGFIQDVKGNRITVTATTFLNPGNAITLTLWRPEQELSLGSVRAGGPQSGRILCRSGCRRRRISVTLSEAGCLGNVGFGTSVKGCWKRTHGHKMCKPVVRCRLPLFPGRKTFPG
jgi:hypothetical protein